MRSTFRFLLLALMMSGIGCDAGADTEQGSGRTRWLFVLDPTVAEREAVPAFLEGIAERSDLERFIRPNDAIDVWFVQHKLVAEPSVWGREYELDRKEKSWAKSHRQRVASDLNKLRDEFLRRWDEAHAPAEMNRARSCIVTATAEVSRFLDKSSDKRRAPRLFVASDFLEACADWGAVNLENRLADTHSLMPSATPNGLTLAPVNKVVLWRVPSSRVDSSQKQAHLEELWFKALEAFGVSGQAMWFGEHPQQALQVLFPR